MSMPLKTHPSLLKLSDKLSLRYQKTGEGAPSGPYAHDPHAARIFSKSGTHPRQFVYGIRHRSSWTRSFADRCACPLR